jgi:hypothetical protein
MKYVLHTAALLTLLSLSGCCTWMKELNDPEKPANPRGWQVHEDRSTTVRGDFVLAKGESVDDGDIGIKVVEMHGGYCGLHEPVYPEVKLQFFRVSDRSVMCEAVFPTGTAARLDTLAGCEGKLKWGFIGVTAINAKNNWVAFNLS